MTPLAKLLALLPGVLLVAVGFATIAYLGSLPYVGGVYTAAGIVAVLFGIFWLLRARALLARGKPTGRRGRPGEVVFTLLLLGLAAAATVAHAATPTRWCYYLYQRVLYAEYVITGLVIIAGFLGLLPLLMRDNPIGAMLGPLSAMGQLLVFFIVAYFLLLFPLDPMFVVTKNNMCYININNLKTQGPPLLRIILTLFSPPPPPA